uniref:Clathrin adaptor alpha/beta/gamma-adaptin appendage Ig-like subdomain domain-containing protein n=1 Tax=Arcella intermedia TaxID=1963864 RepID=A0A6B2L3V8_9EUKA
MKQQQEAALREAALRQQQEAALKQQQENALRQQQEYALRLQQENVLRQQQEVSMRETALRQQQENAIRQQQENTLRQQQESALRQQQENSIRQQQENVLRQQQEMALRQQQEIAMKQQKEASLKQQQEAFRLQQQKESAFRLPENVLGPQPSMSLPMVPIQFTAETTRPQTIASHTLTADERATKATRKLTIVDSGVLYEDDSIQIALKSDYQRGEGRLDFYIANRTLEQVSGLRILVPPVSYVTSRLTPPPPTIAPQSQAVFQIIYKCEVPFESYPDIQFSMLVRGLSKILKLKVPLAITKFCDPQPCEAQHWFGAWNQIKGFPLEIQNMFQAVTANVVHIQELLSKGFRFAVISGVDTNPLNLVGASFFRSTQGEFPCFARLETNPSAGMIRLTLKSSNAQLTSSLRNIFLLHLGVESSQGQPSQSSLPSMPSLPSQSSQPSQPSFPKGW